MAMARAMVSSSSFLTGLTFETVPGLVESPLLKLNVTNTFRFQYRTASDGYEEDGFSEPCRSLNFVLPTPLSRGSFRQFRDKLKQSIYSCFRLCLDPAFTDQLMPHVLTQICTNILTSEYMGFCLAVNAEVVKVTSESPRFSEANQLDETSIMDSLGASLITSLTALTSLTGASKMVKKEIYGGGGSGSCCAVCLEDFCEGIEVSRLPCSHIFHGPCVSKWFLRKTSCPVCRTELHR